MNKHSIPQTAIRAILYARVSGDDRKYATSGIESQLDDCRRSARQKGYYIVKEVYEEPEKKTSGAAWLPEMEKIVRDAGNGNFDVLIVREVDRFARNRLKQLLLENDLKRKGIRVEYVIGQYEDTPEGDLLKGLVAEVAEYERKKILERTRRGKVRSVEAGNVDLGGLRAPFGYDLVQTVDPTTGKERRQLIINEAEAAAVRLIFDLYANQLYSHRTICLYLRDHLYPKPRKSTAHQNQSNQDGWSMGSLNHILRNETYIGQWHYRKVSVVKNEQTGKTSKTLRPRDEWLPVQVPAIISPALFAAAQARREANKREKGRQRKHSYALGGMIKCGHCGNGISGASTNYRGKNYFYYRCNVNSHNSPDFSRSRCPSANYRLEPVEKAIWVWVKGLLLEPEVRAKGIEDARAKDREQLQPKLNRLEASKAELEQLEVKLKNYNKAIEDGMPWATIAADYTALNEKIKNLKPAVENLDREIEVQMITPELEEELNTLGEEVQANLEFYDHDAQAQRLIFRKLNMAIKLYRQDGQAWADCECLLGAENLSIAFSNITPQTTPNG